jgi:hypothetical protein
VAIADDRLSTDALVWAGGFEFLDTAWAYADMVARNERYRVPVAIRAEGEILWKAPVAQCVPGGVFRRSQIIESLAGFGREYGLDEKIPGAEPEKVKERVVYELPEPWPVMVAQEVWRRVRRWFLDWWPLGWFL